MLFSKMAMSQNFKTFIVLDTNMSISGYPECFDINCIIPLKVDIEKEAKRENDELQSLKVYPCNLTFVKLKK